MAVELIVLDDARGTNAVSDFDGESCCRDTSHMQVRQLMVVDQSMSQSVDNLILNKFAGIFNSANTAPEEALVDAIRSTTEHIVQEWRYFALQMIPAFPGDIIVISIKQHKKK